MITVVHIHLQKYLITKSKINHGYVLVYKNVYKKKMFFIKNLKYKIRGYKK